MVRPVFILLLFASAVEVNRAILSLSVGYFYSFRCSLADTFLKDTLVSYNEIVSHSFVSFYYHSRTVEGQRITQVNDTYFIQDIFDKTIPTRVVIHGYWSGHDSKINRVLKEAFLSNFDVNLIIVNYSKVSRDSCYTISRSRVGFKGKKIAEFLDSILEDNDWQWKNLVIVGHSLGKNFV